MGKTTKGTSDRENVQVAVRVRPISPRELKNLDAPVVKVDESSGEVHIPVGAKRLSQVKCYGFDHAFGPTTTQQHLFETVCRPLVEEALQGFNCTIFAYGQTGTGKTFTMEGTSDSRRTLHYSAGVIPRAINAVFASLSDRAEEYTVQVSHLEIYNENLVDLLAMPTDKEDNLRVFDEATKGTYVSSLTELVVEKEEDILSILGRSSQRRRTAETVMNKTSSRSHSIFTIKIHARGGGDERDGLLRVGKLNLVDLAGSENISRSGAVGARSREAGNINQSLLTLGRVISALVDGQPHVPYRDSKLTRLLQESLGGRNKTLIIATCSPTQADLEETHSAIEYAYRAKRIKNRPSVNAAVKTKDKISELAAENSRLRRELEATRTGDGVYLPADQHAALLAKEERQDYLENLVAESSEMYRKALSAMEAAEEANSAAQERAREAEERVLLKCKELEVAGAERDEARFLAAAREQNEHRLHGEVKSARDAMAAIADDAEKLHGAIGHQRSVEESNLQASKSLATALSAQIGELRQTMLGFTETQRRDGVKAADQLDRFTEAHNRGVSQMAQELDALWQLVTQCISSSRTDMDAFLQDSETKRRVAHEQVAAGNAQARLGGEGLRAAMEATLKSLCDRMAAMHDSVIEFQRASRARRDSELLFTKVACDRGTENLVALNATVQGELQRQRDVLAILESNLRNGAASRRARAKAAREELTGALQAAVAALSGAVVDGTEQRTRALHATLLAVKKDLATGADDQGLKLESAAAAVTAAVEGVRVSASAHADEVERLHATTAKRLEQVSVAARGSSRQLTRQATALVEEAGERVRSRVEEFLASEQARAPEMRRSIARQLSATGDAASKAAQDAADLAAGSRAGVDGLVSAISATARSLEGAQSGTDAAYKDYCSAIETSENDLDAALQRRLRPSPSTPRRRKWHIPERLHSTAPHEELLAALRQEREDSGGHGVPHVAAGTEPEVTDKENWTSGANAAPDGAELLKTGVPGAPAPAKPPQSRIPKLRSGVALRGQPHPGG